MCRYLSNLEDLIDLLSKSGCTRGFRSPAVGAAQVHARACFCSDVALLHSHCVDDTMLLPLDCFLDSISLMCS